VLTIDTILQPSADVLHTTLHNREAVILHMPTAKYYSLNRTAARIWRLIGDGLSLGEISGKIVVEYEVGRAEAESSVIALAESLIDARLGSIVSE
jgi:hypothetical protein